MRRDLVEHLVLEWIPNLTVMVKVKARLGVDVRTYSDPCGALRVITAHLHYNIYISSFRTVLGHHSLDPQIRY